MSKQLLFLCLCFSFSSVKAECFFYFYSTPSQVYIKAPEANNSLGRLVGKTVRECASIEKSLSSRYLKETEYEALAKAASDKHNVDVDLILAVIKAESFFDVNAVSHKGAKGLMQLMDSNIKKFAVTDPFDAGQNIEAGTRLLGELNEVYNNQIDLVLAAYNAGEGAVSKHGGVPPFKETKNYIAKVKRYLDELKSV